MTLQSWLENRWLTKHDPSPDEIADLLAVVDLGTYERAGTTSPSEADEVYRLAIRLREDVVKWLADGHPNLVPDV